MPGIVLPEYRRELDYPAFPIKEGDKSLAVKRLQEWLCYHGFNIEIDSDFGPATKAALRAFQRSTNTSSVLGDCTALTWDVLSAPLRIAASAPVNPAKTFGEAVCIVAAEYERFKAREFGGDNRGMFQRHFARGRENQPWCQDYASTMWFQAARALGLHSLPFDLCDANGVASSYVPWVANSARRAGKLRLSNDERPVPKGSMFFLKGMRGGDVSYTHVGIVTEDRGDTIVTNEGNSNNTGSSNGYAVVIHYRRRSTCDFGICE